MNTTKAPTERIVLRLAPDLADWLRNNGQSRKMAQLIQREMNLTVRSRQRLEDNDSGVELV